MYELFLNIVATLLVTLIGILGAWLSVKLGKKQELQNIAEAMDQVILAAQITVGELQQTVVENMKVAGGKLTPADITALGKALLVKSMEKISDPAAALLTAANVDITAVIAGAGEDWISKIKGE